MYWFSFKAKAWGNGKKRKYFWDLLLMSCWTLKMTLNFPKVQSFHLSTEEDNYCTGCMRDVKQNILYNRARTGRYFRNCFLSGFVRATRNDEDFFSHMWLMHMMKVGQLVLRLVSISLHDGTRAQSPVGSMTWGMIFVQSECTCHSCPAQSNQCGRLWHNPYMQPQSFSMSRSLHDKFQFFLIGFAKMLAPLCLSNRVFCDCFLLRLVRKLFWGKLGFEGCDYVWWCWEGAY